MYKIIRYKDDMTIHQVIPSIIDLVIESKKISWKTVEGIFELQGDPFHFLVVDNSEIVGDTVTADLIAKDQKNNFKSEVAQLKSHIKELSEAIDFLLLG